MSLNFLQKYQTDLDFKEFVDSTNTDEVLMDFIFSLYMRFGKDTIKEAGMFINANLLNIDRVIEYYTNCNEFEKCALLSKIKDN